MPEGNTVRRVAAGQAITVSVPATSANLGPGFDCLGLALGLRDTLTVRTVAGDGVSVSVTGEGADTLPTDASHLVARTILRRWAELGFEPAGLEIEADNRIPHGRGLGSSAAAIVSALAAADALLPAGFGGGPDALFEAAALLEGHPDNVAPAIYGGLTLSWQDGAEFRSVGAPIDAGIVPVVAVPDVELSTHRARGLLPASVPHDVAAANGARVALLVRALTGEPGLLFDGTVDHLHQGFRAEAMPESAALIAHLRAEGMAAVVSGAGPTVLVLAADAGQAQLAADLIESSNTDDDAVRWRVWMPGVDAAGAKVEVHQR